MKKNKLYKSGLAMALALTLACSQVGCGVLLEEEPAVEVEALSQGLYAYETLTQEEQQVYDEITSCIQQRAESVTLSTVSEEEMEKVYWAICYDHCEFFWSEGYQYEVYTNRRDQVVRIVFFPIYTMTEEEQAEYQMRIDEAVEVILETAPTDGSDYDKALYVYETLIRENEYNISAQNNQNILSVFLTHETVCLGYAYAAQYLLRELDVPCTSVFGMSEEESHAWNLIQMDGEYYYMDITWGEMAYWLDVEDADEVPPEQTDGTKVPSTGDTKMINYCYFGVSDADQNFAKKHVADSDVPLPACTAEKDNYFIHEGLYFDSWNEALVGERIAEAYESGDTYVYLKFADSKLYADAFSALIEEGHWSKYCNLEQIMYIDQVEENVLLLEF